MIWFRETSIWFALKNGFKVQVSPIFQKFTPLRFYERPTLVPVFANRKKSEEDFHFYEKRLKAKIAFSACFATSHDRGSGHSSNKTALPRDYISISASSCHSSELYL